MEESFLASCYLFPISWYSWDRCWLCSFPSAVSGVYRFMMWRSERQFLISLLRWMFGDRWHVLPIFWWTDLHLRRDVPVCPRQKSQLWEIHRHHSEHTLWSCESCLHLLYCLHLFHSCPISALAIKLFSSSPPPCRFIQFVHHPDFYHNLSAQ